LIINVVVNVWEWDVVVIVAGEGFDLLSRGSSGQQYKTIPKQGAREKGEGEMTNS
jgi:hypothetical protein